MAVNYSLKLFKGNEVINEWVVPNKDRIRIIITREIQRIPKSHRYLYYFTAPSLISYNSIHKENYNMKPEQIEEFKKRYPNESNRKLSKDFDITIYNVGQMGYRLGLRKVDKHAEAKALALRLYPKVHTNEVARITGLPLEIIRDIATKAGVKKEILSLNPPTYYQHKDEILRRYPNEASATICADFNITNATLQQFCYRYGVKKAKAKKAIEVVKKPTVKVIPLKKKYTPYVVAKPTEKEASGLFDIDNANNFY